MPSQRGTARYASSTWWPTASTIGRRVELLIVGQRRPDDPSWQLAEEIQDRFDAAVDLRLLYQRDEMYSVSVR